MFTNKRLFENIYVLFSLSFEKTHYNYLKVKFYEDHFAVTTVWMFV